MFSELDFKNYLKKSVYMMAVALTIFSTLQHSGVQKSHASQVYSLDTADEKLLCYSFCET